MPLRFLPALLLLFLATPVFADNGLIRKQSLDDVPTTMDRLQHLVEDKGLTVFARIDHGANAKAVDMKLRDAQVLLFGNPKAGTPVMWHDIRAGLELPLRVLVYKGADENTWVLYRNPQALKKDFGVEECANIGTMEVLLHDLTEKTVNPD